MENNAKNQSHKNRAEKTHKKPRVIVFDFYSEMMSRVILNLQSRGIEIVYWADGKKWFMDNIFENKKLFPNTIFHSAHDAIQGLPAKNIDVSSFAPVSQLFLEKLGFSIIPTLLMMDNVDFTGVPLMKRVRLYHKYLRYWYGVLTTFKPDAVIFYDAPHMAYKFVAYCLAKQLGIKVIMPLKTPVGGRLILTNDFKDYHELKKTLALYKGKRFTKEHLSSDIKDYYEKQRSVDKQPFYIRSSYIEKNTRNLSRLLPNYDTVMQHIKYGTGVTVALAYVKMLFGIKRVPNIEPLALPFWRIRLQEKKWQKMKHAFRGEYLQYQEVPDYTKKYIYVPLHNQPECSTNPLGEIFADQILMIDTLSHTLPEEWIIYVKENPLQWKWPRTHAGRFKGYTEEIVQKNNVRVVPVETSSFDLIKHSQAVAAVTSTAMLEGLLRGKPALVFGNVWFMYCDGAFPVRDSTSVRLALEQIKKGAVPNQQEIITFLKAFDDVSLCGYRDYRFKHGEGLNATVVKDDQDNIKSFADGLYKELTKEEQGAKHKA